MAEKSEHEASKTGQDQEAPEQEQTGAPAEAEKDSQSDAPVGTDESENPLYTEGSEVGNPAPGTGYVENPDFVPDPTAMSGTLETSGTGGGANETLRGTTGVFEEAGLPSYRSTDVVDGDNTGQPNPVQGAGATPTSYQETTISGGAAPGMREGEAEGAFTTARKPAEASEDDKTSEETKEDEKDAQEPAEGNQEQSETKAPAKQTAAAKKTAAKKTTASRTQPKS